MDHSLLINTAIYLAAAVVAVPIAKRLGLGAVLGYLLAGIVVGPWGLGLVRDVEAILHFGEFGVVLLLFVIGLELEPSRLWAMRKPIFGYGSAQVLGVAALLAGASVLLGVPWKIALVAGLGLALSSTAIALATMGERNLMGTPVGSTSFSILLFQDIAAIPIIALIPLLAPETPGSGGGGWLGMAKVVAVIGGLVLAGRTLVRPVLRAIANTGMREMFTAFSLLLVLSIALLMQWVELSMALGAFVAGVLLADSEYRHALETDLEPFKGLLLGLFFMAVGMSVDFGVLMTRPLLVLGLVAGFMAIKLVVMALLGRLFGLPRSQRMLFAFLLAQGGEFAFVVFGMARETGLFSREVESILVLVVALSMVCTPFLMILHDRVIAPRYRVSSEGKADTVPAGEDHVIIAGYGRVGQIIGRLLAMNHVKTTILEHDPDQVELVRRFGAKVFYGDATRPDLLHAAGAAKARVLVVAVDDIDDSLKLVDMARREFPDLAIVARARNVTHYYDLMDRGVQVIERETFESSLMLGRHTLEMLGYGAWQARQLTQRFKLRNVQGLLRVYPHYKNQEQYLSASKQARDELEAMMAQDAKALQEEGKPGAW